MIYKIVYNSEKDDISLIYDLMRGDVVNTWEVYDENHYKQKKKAIMIKASCGTKLTPFVAIYNDNKDLVNAFYSETEKDVLQKLQDYLINEILNNKQNDKSSK